MNMLIVEILVLGLMLLVIPTIIGSIFVKVNKGQAPLVFSWVSGQMVLWAGFFVITVPMILLQKNFNQTCMLVNAYTGLLVLVAAIVNGRKVLSLKKSGMPLWGKGKVSGKSKGQVFWWCIFWGLLVLQFVLAVICAYEEGDDAFYIAIATITEESNSMYIKLPYTGGSTGLDARHGLAPFPVWIAYLARLSGMHAATVAQIILAISILGLAYGVCYLMTRHLCEEKKDDVPFFMILVELLFVFGGYSVFSVENFILVRASQGKAVLAAIVLPYLFYLLLLFVKNLQKEEKVGALFVVQLVSATMAGCLCSTLGTILICMMLGMAGLCIALSFRKWKVLLPMAFSCITPVVIALLYFTLR